MRTLKIVMALALAPLVGGCAREAAADDAAVSGQVEGPSAADRLASLPDGEERRRFILDCTGCHTFREDVGWPGGAARTHGAWSAAVSSMVARFGATSGFPVIGAGRDAEATAAWLVRWLPQEPAAARPVAVSLLGRAEFREYPLPAPQDLPHDVALDRGKVLVTGMFTGRIYLLDPATGAVTEEATPQPNPRAIEVDSAGNWWVVLGGPALLAKRSRDGRWSTFDAGFYAHSVALAQDGGVWLNGHFTHRPERMRRIDATTGAHRDFTIPTHPDFATTPVPYEIRVAPDGAVWMSELQGNRLVRLDPATGESKIWAMPTPWSGPRRLDVAPDGTVWIPEYAANRLAKFDPATERFEEYALPVDAASPYIARWDARRGVVWIGTGAADMVFRFDPATGSFRAYPLPSRDQLVRHLVIDAASGDLWLAPGSSPGTGGAQVVRMRPLD